MRHEQTTSSTEQTLRSATPSRVATDDPQTVEPSGEGDHRLPEGSISPIPETTVERNPLTDPRAGDIVAAADGGVIEILDVILGHGAGVWVREDSGRYAITHEGYRDIVRGGRVIHLAEVQS